MPSDIHVFVRFKEPCVFAGEDVHCTITFKNVLDLQTSPPAALHQRRRSRQGSIDHLAAISRNGGSGRGLQNPRLLAVGGTNGRNSAARGHKATMSLSIPTEFSAPLHEPRARSPGRTVVQVPSTHRSVSIISAVAAGASPLTPSPPDEHSGRQRMQPPGGHPRSPRTRVISSIVSLPHGASSTEPQQQRIEMRRQNSSDAPDSVHGTLQIPNSGDGNSPLPSVLSAESSKTQSQRSTPEFALPAQTKTNAMPVVPAADNEPFQRSTQSRVKRDRVLSETSLGGSERSSAEFHSLSNHSQETLVSEQASLVSERPRIQASRMRPRYDMDAPPARRPLVTNLLMGYAQVMATFTLDGSLVDQSSFEEVKRKGFLGGQAGGGVVGMKKSQYKGSLLGGFNLSNISESLGSIMNNSDMSSVKEMRAMANARAIPLLSTPQSLLFVDLRLSPGEEKSFTFSYKLPMGLPSSYKGKAIRIAYNLTIGVQGAPGERDVQAVRQVNIPLRVFAGVNKDGEIFGHDLMQPHVILRDAARTGPAELENEFAQPHSTVSPATEQSSSEDFLNYVDTLLDKNRRRQSSSGTLNQTFWTSNVNAPPSARQFINRAILVSNQTSGDENSPNRFEIARGGLRVAVVTLDRALHRIGETVTAVVNFSEGQLLCSSFRATLETSEKVASSLAVRSAASISRVTRKVYATHSENSLFAERIVFSPSIPDSATPTFLTSGVNLDWCLKFEFGTTRLDETDEGVLHKRPDLLEEIVKDERGTVMAATENLDCETFEVVIPITVYGDIVTDSKEDDEVIGLPI